MAIFLDCLFGYFLVSVFYLFFFTLTGIRKIASIKIDTSSVKIFKISILIPAYKEDNVLIAAVDNIIAQIYPKEKLEIVIIADSLKKNILSDLNQRPVSVLRVNFQNSTKAKSLQKGLDYLIGRDVDIAVILDADNLVQNDFCQKINKAFCSGTRVLQGQRVAKNLNTSMAYLDALSEIINNHIFRKGHVNVGLSSSLIGSGMAFEFELLQELMQKITAVGGFDKELQLSIVERGIKIKYTDEILIFDEKIENVEQLKNQRRRWMSSQYYYLKENFFKSFKMLAKGDFDFFNLGFLQNLFLPKYLNLGFLIIIVIILSLFNGINLSFISWYALLVIHILVFVIPIPMKFYNRQMIQAILRLPLTFFNLLFTLMKISGANKEFIHTEHSHDSVDHDMYDK